MKTLVVIPGRKVSVWTPPMHDAWERGLPATVEAQRDDGSLPSFAGFDVVISRLKFRHLARMPAIDWSGFRGLRVHSDEDGFWDALWSTSPYRGQWQVHIPRHGFDLLVVTGMRTQEHFEACGIPTLLVHKAYDPRNFFDRGGPRTETLVTYGADYPARVIARQLLAREGIQVERVVRPFTELNAELNKHLACLVCTLDAPAPGGPLRRFNQRLRGTTPSVGPGPEPMYKLFESVASGCATFTDWSPDLEGLGFVDGVNAIFYRSLEELVEKTKYFLARPDELRRIGASGAALAQERHTWAVRTQTLRTGIESVLAQRALVEGPDGSPA